MRNFLLSILVVAILGLSYISSMMNLQIKDQLGTEVLNKINAELNLVENLNDNKKVSTTILEKYLNTLNKDLKLTATLRYEYDNHGVAFPHATTSYQLITDRDYYQAVSDLNQAIKIDANILNFHIPFEIQFHNYRDFNKGYAYMNYIVKLCDLFGVIAVWENAPILKYGEWSLVQNTDFIPKDYQLCLDIGHLMLGSKNQEEALRKIDDFMANYGHSVIHLHLHINNFIKDQHTNDPNLVQEFLGTERFLRLTNNRTFIFEKGA
jgi:hypothetical protein